MPVTDPIRQTADARLAAGLSLALAVSGAVLVTAFLLSFWMLPRQLVLPVVCVAALATAGAVAFVAWLHRASNRSHPTYWDIAGALTLIGMCAAILSEPDEVIPLLEAATRNR